MGKIEERVEQIDKIGEIKIEAADEWKASCDFFNYHATLDPDCGFVTIKFNFRDDFAIPPVFDAVVEELRKKWIPKLSTCPRTP